MALPRLPIAIFCAAVAIYLLGVLTYQKGYDAGRAWERQQSERLEDFWIRQAWRDEVDLNGSRAQTRDAMQRWLRKTGASSMEGRYPRVMFFPDKNCIQFMIAPPGVGGEPIYCYRVNTLQLTEEHSDVQ